MSLLPDSYGQIWLDLIVDCAASLTGASGTTVSPGMPWSFDTSFAGSDAVTAPTRPSSLPSCTSPALSASFASQFDTFREASRPPELMMMTSILPFGLFFALSSSVGAAKFVLSLPFDAFGAGLEPEAGLPLPFPFPAVAASGAISANARTSVTTMPRPPLPQSTLERSPPRPPVPQSALLRSLLAPRSLGFDIPLLFAPKGCAADISSELERPQSAAAIARTRRTMGRIGCRSFPLKG